MLASVVALSAAKSASAHIPAAAACRKTLSTLPASTKSATLAIYKPRWYLGRKRRDDRNGSRSRKSIGLNVWLCKRNVRDSTDGARQSSHHLNPTQHLAARLSIVQLQTVRLVACRFRSLDHRPVPLK